jgi:DNA integrity scanning protein DisA with diadenylate cyclase activity
MMKLRFYQGFTGILVFILIWQVVTQVLEMKLLGSIFDTLMKVGVIALIVLFQIDTPFSS